MWVAGHAGVQVANVQALLGHACLLSLKRRCHIAAHRILCYDGGAEKVKENLDYLRISW